MSIEATLMDALRSRFITGLLSFGIEAVLSPVALRKLLPQRRPIDTRLSWYNNESSGPIF
jgi:hypothetical protein